MALTDYYFDPADPRAPSSEQWAKMTDEERRRVVDQLPSEPPMPRVAPEGDRHRIPKERAVQALGEYFKRIGRSIYLSAELPVYYPDSPWFAPDLLAVLDVDRGLRSRWVVEHEKRGLDLVLEVTLSGDRKKDLVDNVKRYEHFQIPEYFVLDLQANRIIGYRLSSGGIYEPIVPQGGRWSSRVLGLELTLQEDKIRFCAGSAVLLESDELIGQLSTMVDELVRKEEGLAETLEKERQRAADAEERAEEEKMRAERLAAKLRSLGVDPDEG